MHSFGSAQISEAQETFQFKESKIAQKLEYDDKWIDAQIQQVVTRGEKLPSESEFYRRQAALLAQANEYIVFRGYDVRFMEEPRTRKILSILPKFVDIYALLPESLDTTLDEVYRELSNDPLYSKRTNHVVIVRTSDPLDKGYILCDDWFVGVWDSSSVHHDQQGSDVYYKTFSVNRSLNDFFGKKFLIETKQDSVHVDSTQKALFPKLRYFSP